VAVDFMHHNRLTMRAKSGKEFVSASSLRSPNPKVRLRGTRKPARETPRYPEGHTARSARICCSGGRRGPCNVQTRSRHSERFRETRALPLQFRREGGDDFFKARITTERVVPRQQFQSAVSDKAG